MLPSVRDNLVYFDISSDPIQEASVTVTKTHCLTNRDVAKHSWSIKDDMDLSILRASIQINFRAGYLFHFCSWEEHTPTLNSSFE